MKLADADLLKLLPDHLANDPAFSAAGQALRPFLGGLARAIPNLLVFARLGRGEPEKFLPPLRRLTEARPGLAPLDMETLESLAWQFHVDFREAAQNRQQLAGMVLDSIPWHRIKGTPASIQAALKLCGFFDIRVEEHTPGMPWASYQLGFNFIQSADDLARIVEVCREMQPARCKLWRVYVDDYDFRPGVWSGSLPKNAWSMAWWSGYSGCEFPDLPGMGDRGLIVSFGLKRRYQSQPWSPGPDLARIWLAEGRASIIPRLSHYVWSRSRWSDFYPPKNGFVAGELYSGHLCEYQWESGPWPGKPWPDSPWGQNIRWDRLRPSWRMFWRQSLKSQGVWSDTSAKGARGWSMPNRNWSWPLVKKPGQAPLWSAATWSGKTGTCEIEALPEQFYRRHAGQAQALEPKGGLGFVCHESMARHWRKLDAPMWGQSAWSQGCPLRHGLFGGGDLATLAGEALYETQIWPEAAWKQRPWAKISGWGREYPAWRMFWRQSPKSQGAWAENGAWSAANCYWSWPLAQILDRGPVWSDDNYSGPMSQPRLEAIMETGRARAAVASEELGPGEPAKALGADLPLGAGEPLSRWPDIPWPCGGWAFIHALGQKRGACGFGISGENQSEAEEKRNVGNHDQ